LNGHPPTWLPNTLNVRFPNISGLLCWQLRPASPPPRDPHAMRAMNRLRTYWSRWELKLRRPWGLCAYRWGAGPLVTMSKRLRSNSLAVGTG
jgi:hypothetical protein